MKWEKDLKYDIAHFILAGCYFILVMLSLFLIIKLWRAKHFQRWQRFFHPIFLIGTSVRMVFFLLQPFIMEGEISIPNQYNFIINTTPSFFFFTDYLIVLFLWAEVYHFTNSGEVSINRLSPIFCTITVLMYAVIITLYVLDGLLSPHDYKSVSQAINPYEQTLMTFTAAIYLITSIAFIIYATRIYYKLSKSVPSSNRTGLLRKIQIMGSMISICFGVRGVLVFLNGFWMSDISSWWWFDGVYYFMLEWLPLLLMLAILHKASRKSKMKKQMKPCAVYTRNAPVRATYLGRVSSGSETATSSAHEYSGLLNS